MGQKFDPKEEGGGAAAVFPAYFVFESWLFSIIGKERNDF